MLLSLFLNNIFYKNAINFLYSTLHLARCSDKCYMDIGGDYG